MRGRRGNQVADFLTAFNQTLATVDKVGEGFELAKIANEKPVESTGFTADQGAQLEAAAKTGQYDIGYDQEAKAYTVTPKSDPSKTGMVSMQGVTDFMGNRTAGRLDESQVNNTKLRAMAGVLGKTDPMQGARLLREVTQGERDDQRFKAETVNADRSGKMADLQLRAAEEAEKTRAAQRDFTESFAGVGWSGLPALYERYNDGNTVKVEEDGKGGATLTQIGADGKVVGQQKYGNRLEFYQDAMARFDPAKWAEAQEKREATARAQANADRTYGLDSRRLDITENYYKGTLDINGRKVDDKNSSLDSKMSEPDKVQFSAIGSELKTINDSLIKAQADGLLDPTNPSPGVKALMDRKAALSIQQRQIIGRYQAAEPQADPLGLRKPAQQSGGGPAAAPAPSSAPARRVTKEQQAALDKDIPGILARERDAVLQRIAAGDERAKSDLVAIEREIARLPKGSVPAGRAPTMTSVATEPAPKPAPAMATMTGTAGDRQLKEVAIKNGYKPVTGRDGKTYFSRVVNGQGENLTEEQLAKRLNVGI